VGDTVKRERDLCSCPENDNHQLRPGGDTSQSQSQSQSQSLLFFLSSNGVFLKPMASKHLHVPDNSEYELHHTNIYLYRLLYRVIMAEKPQ
jgi:hypothetical protein